MIKKHIRNNGICPQENVYYRELLKVDAEIEEMERRYCINKKLLHQEQKQYREYLESRENADDKDLCQQCCFPIEFLMKCYTSNSESQP